jgi:nitrate reductase NapE component
MITEQHSTRRQIAARRLVSVEEKSITHDCIVRAVHIALAIYLIPVLAVVLSVGALGILVLCMARIVTGPFRGSLG